MHIPDGYLSPSTCAALYGVSLPFWYKALRKVKKRLHTRFVPLLSLFGAFCFVVMMFNVPLPGGTSGHAVGVGITAAILGPWASMIAISTALLIQALLFGDGGITAFGANCFNMAIVGSLVASATYRLVSGHSALNAGRRVVGCALAGYLAVNVSALFAAVELGLQPLLFHDSLGVPLYAPYRLGIAIPAMMVGHLSIAGMAELVISGGAFAYLQKTNRTLLRQNAHGTDELAVEFPRSYRSLWAGLGLLLILTPLGLLTVGTAWGEWSPGDFVDPQKRAAITAASGQIAPPSTIPVGLARLSTVWTSPMPAYAPPIFRNAAFGYVMSALTGAGLIILSLLFVSWVARARAGRRTAHE